MLFSRDNKIQVELARLTSSFDLVDKYTIWHDGVVAPNGVNNLRWTTFGGGFGISGGSSIFTLVAIVKYDPYPPGKYTTIPYQAHIFGYKANTGIEFGINPDVTNFALGHPEQIEDAYGQQVIFGNATNQAPGFLPYVNLWQNQSNQEWAFVVIQQNGNKQRIFVNGLSAGDLTINPEPVTGVESVGPNIHSYAPSVTNQDWDASSSGVYWGMSRFAMLMGFSRILTKQELFDIYAMCKYGKGYAISRQNLEIMWLGRRDSITAADIQTIFIDKRKVTVDPVTDIFSTTAVQPHGFSDGDRVAFTSDGTLPDPVVAERTYFVNVLGTLNTFKIYLTEALALAGAGGEINITNVGIGNHCCAEYSTWRTEIPDLSGHARHGRLYTPKYDWELLIGGLSIDSGFYYPRFWKDDNLHYDGSAYNNPIMEIPSYGVSFS